MEGKGGEGKGGEGRGGEGRGGVVLPTHWYLTSPPSIHTSERTCSIFSAINYPIYLKNASGKLQMSPASRPVRGWLARLIACSDYDRSAGWLGDWHCVYVVN